MFERLFSGAQNSNRPVFGDDLTEKFGGCTQIDWTSFEQLKLKIARALPETLVPMRLIRF